MAQAKRAPVKVNTFKLFVILFRMKLPLSGFLYDFFFAMYFIIGKQQKKFSPLFSFKLNHRLLFIYLNVQNFMLYDFMSGFALHWITKFTMNAQTKKSLEKKRTSLKLKYFL